MNKKLLSLLLVLAMALGMLTACGGNNNTETPAADNTPAATETETPAETEAPADVDYGSGTITIWVADNITDFTQAQAAAFIEANPAFAGYDIVVEAVGEGDAAGNMITDVEGGADIYGFAQDQLSRLVVAGALTPVLGDNAAWVAEQNDADAVGAATMGDTIYAYPITSDNGYFLYYDSSVITDPTSLEAILADAEAAGKGVYMEINNGWYQTSFFFGTGCELTYDTDENGFTGANVTYASDAGVQALKAIIALSNSPAFTNGSSVENATNAAAIIDGTWDAGNAQALFGDNYAAAKLPTFTVDGNTYQMSGFSGFKLLGVKPQTDAGKLAACQALAQYLSSADVQLARFEAVGWGPSNLTARQDPAVQADPALAALAEQIPYDIPQGQYPGDYWGLATSLGDSVIANEYDNASDEELMAVLTQFQDTCISYAQ